MLLCRLGGGGGGGGVTVRKSGGKAQGALSWLVHLRRISSIRLTGPTEAQEGGRGAWGCERRGPHGASGAAGSPQWAAATSLEDDGEYAPGAAQRIPAERTLGQTLPLSAARNPNRISTLMLKTDQDYREQGNPIYLPSNAGCDAFSTRPERRASELACAVPRRRPCAPTVRAAEEAARHKRRRKKKDVGEMLPGQVVGVGCAVRPGALLVLRFPRIQTPSRQRHCGRGAEAGGRVAQEPDGHRFVQVSLRTQVSVLCLEIRFCNVRPSGP